MKRKGMCVALHLSDQILAQLRTLAGNAGISQQDIARLALERGIPKVAKLFPAKKVN